MYIRYSTAGHAEYKNFWSITGEELDMCSFNLQGLQGAPGLPGVSGPSGPSVSITCDLIYFCRACYNCLDLVLFFIFSESNNKILPILALEK